MFFKVKDLRVDYDGVEAIKKVSLETEEGMIVTLIGANGAGKTTLLNTICGLKAPTSGEVWFQSRRIDGIPTQNIVKLGIAQVPEERRVFPYMTVLENLEMGAYLRKDKREVKRDLERIFEYFPRLKERTKQQAGRLSGGEQQMVAIGRALMSKPRLFLLDEPSLGLSPVMVQGIAKIIKEINQNGVSIILVEQNANLALRLAHKGYVLETGKVVLEARAEELLHNEKVKKAYLGA
jgi:branched-chain amino acid transport system ATP-binding protein